MTCAPTSISHSSRIRSSVSTWTSLLTCTRWAQRQLRQPTWSAENPDGRWRAYNFDELVARDKTSLDIFWLKDDSLADSDNLPAPGVIALEIVEDLQAALEQFKLIAGDMAGEAIE